MAGSSDFFCDIPDGDNLECLSDYTDTDSCTTASSCSSRSEDDYDPVWLDKVGSKGNLFYIEPGVSLTTSEGISPNQSSTSDGNLYGAKQVKSKLNAADKLKKWMRKRRKKVRKSFPLLNPDNSNCSPNEISVPTFNAGSNKELFVEIESLRPNPGCYNSLSEELLGLALRMLPKFPDEKAIISEFVSNKDVYKINEIKVGDWLKSINDVNVTFRNLDDVLASLIPSSKVKLTIECAFNPALSDVSTFKFPSASNSLVKELIGDAAALENAERQFLNIPHGVFYLSIENELVVEKDGVVYRYPDEDTPLFQQKGIFITLGHMISDVASPPLLNCSLMVQGEIVHVGYVKEDKEIMVLAIPASCATVIETQHFATDVAKLLKYQFSTLGRAFGQTNNARHLNHFFILFFHHHLSAASNQNKTPTPHLLKILPSVHWLPLPTDLKTELDDVLSELESSDFGSSSKGFYGNQRIFSILGSCLFYKGYLLANHLPKSDLLDIHLYLQHHQMLTLTRTQPVSQVIIWREVNPSRRQEGFIFAETEFKEAEGRWFMLVVAMEHSILAVLLEAGGCSLRVEGYPSPEPFYVEEVQNTLIILEECGIIDAINKTFHMLQPDLASPDQFMKEGNSTWHSLSSLFTNSMNLASSASNLTRLNTAMSHSSLPSEKGGSRKSVEMGSMDRADECDFRRMQMLSSMGPADGESDVESDYSEDSAENMMYREKSTRSHSISTGSTSESFESSEYMAYQGQASRQSFASNYDLNLSQTVCGENFQLTQSALKIVTGNQNTLFQYLHMDPVEGIFLAPTHDNHGLFFGPIHKEVLHNFHRCCLKMRIIFERSLRNQEIMKAGIVTKFGINDFLQAAYEQGVLFQYIPKDLPKHKNAMSTLNFWVIGRIFFAPEPREIYVCYHDSAQQDMVEMAFRLGFGLSL